MRDIISYSNILLVNVQHIINYTINYRCTYVYISLIINTYLCIMKLIGSGMLGLKTCVHMYIHAHTHTKSDYK